MHDTGVTSAAVPVKKHPSKSFNSSGLIFLSWTFIFLDFAISITVLLVIPSRNESGIGGIQPKERSFWLIADAELIVYGATDPSATLKIGGEVIPLASDGTFRLQVPFRDGVQNYLIEATDSTGEQNRNINMKFERVTPQDNTNPIDKAKSEWF